MVTEQQVAPGSGVGVRYEDVALIHEPELFVADQVMADNPVYQNLGLARSLVGAPRTLTVRFTTSPADVNVVQVRVTGRDNFWNRVVEESPVFTINDNNEVAYAYLSQVFVRVDKFEYRAASPLTQPPSIALGLTTDLSVTGITQIARANQGVGLPVKLRDAGVEMVLAAPPAQGPNDFTRVPRGPDHLLQYQIRNLIGGQLYLADEPVVGRCLRDWHQCYDKVSHPEVGELDVAGGGAVTHTPATQPLLTQLGVYARK